MSGEVEVAVRRELGKQGRRWGPVALVGLLVVGVLATARDDPAEVATDGTPDATGPSFHTGLGGGSGPSTTDTSVAASPDGPDASPGGARAPAGPGLPGAPAAGQPGAPAQAGVSRTGVTCDGSARQLPESSYGPLCVPEFTGDNGGATSPGVTADEIVVTYRIGSSASTGALQALGGDELESVGFDQDLSLIHI